MGIARLAENLKIDKGAAFDVVKKLANELEGYDNELAILYRYFIPSAKTSGKKINPYNWVRLAIAKKDVRPYFNYVFVKDNEIVGIDGHRLHLIPNESNLPNGYYNKAGDLVYSANEYNYPNYGQIFKASFLPVEVNIDNSNKGFYVYKDKRIEVIKIGDKVYNLQYVKDALRIFSGNTEYSSNDANLLITDGVYKALIASINDKTLIEWY